jgi:hypothetical protein
MALNAAVIMPPLQQVIFDKTLQTFLTNGKVYFWEDANRTIPKDVYTLTGTGPGSYTYVLLGPVLTLSGIGSYIDSSGGNIAVYLWPFTGSPNDMPPSTTAKNYYITVYSSTGVFQFDIPNWPGVSQGASPINIADTTGNVIQNGQFVLVDFPTSSTQFVPFNINTSGVNVSTEIAPDWSIITTGTGQFSVYQKVIIDSTAPGNPYSALGIASTGYTQPLILRQRLLGPRILAMNLTDSGFVSGTFIAQSLTGGNIPLTMNYTASITGTIQQICTGTTTSANFTRIFNSTAVQIANPGGGSGFVDITIVIPANTSIQISCIQLCGVANAQQSVDYLQETQEEQVSGLFAYYRPPLNFKPIPSLLTGWDFPLNPQQFGITDVTTTPQYIWDQTIMASVVGQVAVSTLNTTGAMLLVNQNPNECFYMLQYLSGPEAVKTTLSQLSVNINAYSLGASDVKVSVFLYYSTTNGTIPLLSSGNPTIGTITNAATGQFTLGPGGSGWAPIPQALGFSNNSLLNFNTLTDLPFTGWNGIANFGMATTQNFAIVVTFVTPTVGTSTVVNSISCVPGQIATRPAPQTEDEVFRECQYYYETSYNSPTAVGTSNATGALFIEQSSFYSTNTVYVFPTPFTIDFNVVKRVSPTVTLYSKGGTINKVQSNLIFTAPGNVFTITTAEPAVSTWNATVGYNNANYLPANIAALDSQTTLNGTNNNSAGIYFHYIADARLGKV